MSGPMVLENEVLQAVVAPQKGAGLLAFSLRADDRWLPLMPDARREGCDLEWASFLMIPYSNRVENGRFSFRGQDHALACGETHAIHGDVRRRPWRVEEVQRASIRCGFLSTAHADVNWPWPFEARAEYALEGPVMRSSLQLWNRSAEPFPAGFGWHPYFSRTLTHAGEPVNLRMKVRGIYPDARGNRIPSGPAVPPRPELDFSPGRLVDPSQFFDLCACGYDGQGAIEWPESAVRVRFDCSPALGHLVLYNPLGKPYFAVEPVTNANNGVNLLAAGDPTSGVVVLDPGACLEACFALAVERP